VQLTAASFQQRQQVVQHVLTSAGVFCCRERITDPERI
jgi:hypothetical protein